MVSLFPQKTVRTLSGIMTVLLCTSGCNMARTWVNSTEKVVKDGFSSINLTEPHLDSELDLTPEEFKKKLLTDRMNTGLAEPTKTSADPAIPDMSQILAAPEPPALDNDKLVSLSVTDDVPLKDVLIELGRIADVDIAIDPQIKGGIILRVKDRPLKEVIQKIALLGNLRYSFNHGVLRVERDNSYVENYNVDFLNVIRSSSGGVDISTQVLSSTGGGGEGGGGGGGGVSTGSNNKITTEYSGDLWKSVEEGIKQVLLEAKADTTAAPSLEASATSSTDENRSKESILYVNRQAGIISVRANQKQHHAIKSYLDNVREASSAQVLIEAKIVEVTLNEDYRTGINWNMVDKVSGGKFTGNLVENLGTATDLLTLGVLSKGNTDLEAAVKLTQIFGSSRALSSPRLHAINNQQAVLTFAENEVYFTVTFEEEEDQGTSGVTTTTTNTKSEMHTVPIGVILALQPAIDLSHNEITMNIRPTLSRITGRATDPAVALKADELGSDVSSEVPIIEVREMDSVLKIKSGQVMVIGGLMEERAENNNNTVPGLRKIPLIGQLFKSASNTSEMVETVIFIKATIVPNHGVDNSDKQLYKDFMRDPRPLAF